MQPVKMNELQPIRSFFLFCSDSKDYIELVMKADNSSVPTPSKNPSKRPRVRCDKDSVAQKVCTICFICVILYGKVC